MKKLIGLIFLALLLASPAYAQTAATFTLTWQDNSTNETGFRVYSKSGTVYTQVGQTATNVRTFVHAVNGAQGAQFCYAVSAFNAAGESVRSADACASIPTLLPNPPGLVTITVVVSP